MLGSVSRMASSSRVTPRASPRRSAAAGRTRSGRRTGPPGCRPPRGGESRRTRIMEASSSRSAGTSVRRSVRWEIRSKVTVLLRRCKPDDLVALVEEQLGQVGAVLAGDPGDERRLGHRDSLADPDPPPWRQAQRRRRGRRRVGWSAMASISRSPALSPYAHSSTGPAPRTLRSSGRPSAGPGRWGRPCGR